MRQITKVKISKLNAKKTGLTNRLTNVNKKTMIKLKMNATERAYETHLKILERSEEILWFKFEGMKLKLADKTTYTPDFCVINKNGELEFHETKGYWREDAKIKIKVASAMFPFKFIAIYKKGKNWITEEF